MAVEALPATLALAEAAAKEAAELATDWTAREDAILVRELKDAP